MHMLRLRLLPSRLAICRLAADSDIPAWAVGSAFFSITRTADELSVVCDSAAVPSGVVSDGPWRGVQVEGPLPLTMIGVLASLLAPLAAAPVSVFVLSTFDTDCVLVPEGHLEKALTALRGAGFTIVS